MACRGNCFRSAVSSQLWAPALLYSFSLCLQTDHARRSSSSSTPIGSNIGNREALCIKGSCTFQYSYDVHFFQIMQVVWHNQSNEWKVNVSPRTACWYLLHKIQYTGTKSGFVTFSKAWFQPFLPYSLPGLSIHLVSRLNWISYWKRLDSCEREEKRT